MESYIIIVLGVLFFISCLCDFILGIKELERTKDKNQEQQDIAIVGTPPIIINVVYNQDDINESIEELATLSLNKSFLISRIIKNEFEEKEDVYIKKINVPFDKLLKIDLK